MVTFSRHLLIRDGAAGWQPFAPTNARTLVRRQNSRLGPILKAGLAMTAALGVGACSLSHVARGLDSDSALVTSSIAKPVKAEGIDSTDAELIKNLVASADKTQQLHALAWSSPDTGNSGTIMAIDKFIGSHGQKCKKFETTVDSFMGISLYDGETCELRAGFWVLSWFIRKEK